MYDRKYTLHPRIQFVHVVSFIKTYHYSVTSSISSHYPVSFCVTGSVKRLRTDSISGVPYKRSQSFRRERVVYV